MLKRIQHARLHWAVILKHEEIHESPLLCEESAFRSSSNDRCHKCDKYDNCVLIKVKIFYI